MRRRRLLTAEPLEGARELVQHVAQIAFPLEGPADLDPLLERIGDARYVLLGEASHGTSEYYQWRARISQRLIRGIVLSKTYGRGSRWESANLPLPSFFAVARVRPLTPMQLALSLRLATLDQGRFATMKPDEVERRVYYRRANDARPE